MNDAERDAWLREALRHAPDSDALPPSGVSEAILLKARAAARATAPPTRRAGSGDARANPLMALWNWLARPPVAAGFASVMAATLVGLMWWDRPMDEAMPRPPALASERAPTSTSPAPAAAPPATVVEATPSTPDARPMNEAANNVAADSALARRKRSAPEQAGAAGDTLADRAAAPAERSVDMLAKRQAPAIERKNEAPAPFPSAEMQRETPSPRKSLDKAAANDASKKDVEAPRSRAADEVERAAAPATARPVAPPAAVPPPPVGATEPAPQSPLASGRLAADERRQAAPAESAVAAKEKSAAANPPASPTPADTPRLQQPRNAFGGMREQDPAGLAPAPPVPSAAPAPLRSESQRRGSDVQSRADASTVAVAPARVLAAIAADPARWSRQTAGGDSVALHAGWRAWLAELDTATVGRWQPLGAAIPAPDGAASRDGSTTLRLVTAGRVAAIVRLDGTRVQVDAAPGTGADRWQATLVPADAEQLRSSARRLSP
jgi:hypothetical protein